MAKMVLGASGKAAVGTRRNDKWSEIVRPVEAGPGRAYILQAERTRTVSVSGDKSQSRRG